MPPKIRTSTSIVGNFSEGSTTPRKRTPSAGRSSAKLAAAGNPVAAALSAHETSNSTFPAPTAEFAPNAHVHARADWGKLLAILSLEILFFVWLKWAADVSLWGSFAAIF